MAHDGHSNGNYDRAGEIISLALDEPRLMQALQDHGMGEHRAATEAIRLWHIADEGKGQIYGIAEHDAEKLLNAFKTDGLISDRASVTLDEVTQALMNYGSHDNDRHAAYYSM